MKSKLLGIALFLLAVVPASASTTTYTDSAAYFAAAGPQTFQDFNSPLSSTATSVTYPDLLYTCTSSAFCTTSDGQGGLSVFVTTPGLATFTFNSPIKSFGISILSLGTIILDQARETWFISLHESWIDGPIGYEDARGRTKGYFCLVLSLTRQPTCMGG